MNIYHTPQILKSLAGIKAGITYANRDSININGKLPGLNLGDNTIASEAEVKRNFERFSEELSWNRQHIALAEQVHGAEVEIIREPGFYPGLDGFITRKEGLAIAVKVADCAAVLMADPSTNTIAAVHAGWRGAAANITLNVIGKLSKACADLSNTLVYLSPCISLKHFEVGEEVAAQFPSIFVNRQIGSKPHLDLKSFLKKQLLDAGIQEQHIEIDPRCTIEDDRFYSFRRERDNAGRMLAFIRYSSNTN